jgi:myosin-3
LIVVRKPRLKGAFSSFECPFLVKGHRVAVKILENVTDNIEEIEEEFLVLRDLSLHPNIPAFHGLYLRRGATTEEDQLWFVMEVRFRN